MIFRNLQRILPGILLAAILAPLPAVAAESFELPPGLEQDVEFWTRIFGEINSDQALLHDSRYLEVVYEVVEIPENATPTRRRRIADLSRERYKKTLRSIAAGDRTSLNGEELRVLGLWPEGVTNEELQQAAKRIRFQQGLSDRFEAGLKRSGAWKPYIEEQLELQDVPIGLAALPHVESSFNPMAHSHVGASGLWQFTRSTGRRYMEIDHVVDERRDPFRSSESAAELLANNYRILQSWPLAITAYNHGVSGMRRAVQKLDTENFTVINREYDGRSFGFASRNFYVAFLAALEVEQNSEFYFGAVELDEPRPDLVIESPSYIPVATYAEILDVSEETLRTYNPALLAPVWDGTKYVPRGYQVRIPQALVDASEYEILQAIPTSQRFAKQTPDMYHKIRRGESLSVIAARYDTSTRELMSLNGLKSKHRIRAGQTLRLPFAGVSIPEGAETYTVRSGDSLSAIAQRTNISQASLMELNNLKNRNQLNVGQVLYLLPPSVAEVAPAPVVIAVPALVASVAPMSVPAESLTAAELIGEESSEELEPVAEMEAAAAATASLADPNDYSVSSDNTIEIQAAETLGHYADWLNVKTQQLRNVNGMSYSKPVVVGQRIKLDFSNVSTAEFTARRIAHHRDMQEAYFMRYRVTDTTEHKLKDGESLWVLTHQRYKVPVWLVRQYNPDLDFGRIQPGMRIVFPRVERVNQQATSRQSVAKAG